MREKSLELHRERNEQRERNRSEGYEQQQQLFRYPNQPTPINVIFIKQLYFKFVFKQLGGMSRMSWSAPLPVEHRGQPPPLYKVLSC